MSLVDYGNTKIAQHALKVSESSVLKLHTIQMKKAMVLNLGFVANQAVPNCIIVAKLVI